MCSFDSTEVSDMLCHLTSYGRVKKTEKGWVIEKTEYVGKYDKFRECYLEDAESILKSLSDVPKTTITISKEIDKLFDLIELYLLFLVEITKLGSISRISGETKPIWYAIEQ